MLKLKYSLMCFLIMLAPTVVWATDATIKVANAEQSWWQVLVAELLKWVFVFAVPILSYLAAKLLQRWNIDVEQKQVEAIAKKAADWAEHKAEIALKSGSKKTPGAEKMALALKVASDLATTHKLPEKATGKLKELIEASIDKKEEKEVQQPPTVKS